ncbi:MAG: ATP synthase F1 subunit gamma [Ktedonobacterales bacterium]|nr:ATP synthase F1 subunit gamma [Ktedonobacterales bacterium]
MATAREIRRRIRSVKNVAQITRALQLVASSKLRRTQARVLSARPYADELQRVLIHLSHASADDDEPSPYFYSDREDADLRLLQQRAIKRVGIVVVSPDGTLAGALPGNVNRKALAFAQEQKTAHGLTDADVRFVAVGKRGRDFLVRNRLNVIADFTGLGDMPKSSDVRAIARVISDAYLSGEVDSWHLIYPKFVSSLIQTPTEIQLLPVQPPEAAADAEVVKHDYIFEPDAGTIYAALLPRYVETLIYQPLLELVASFYAAQFVAMKSATDNANDLAADLNLTYNKARQAAITTQILEVVSGAGDQ